MMRRSLIAVLAAIALVTSSCTIWVFGGDAPGAPSSYDYFNVQTAMPIADAQKTADLDLGGDHSCSITESGTVLCWGNNDFDQRHDPRVLSSEDRRVSNQDWRQPDWYGLAYHNFVTIAAGQRHTCAITGDPELTPASLGTGRLFCWGDNTVGQLGDGTTAPPDSDDYTWGPGPIVATETIDPLYDPYPDNWLDVSLGDEHTCALNDPAELWCWGSNNRGQLGNATTTASLSPVRIGSNKTWVTVSAGGRQTCAITANGGLWCWGRNTDGELGQGTTADSWVPVQVSAGTTWIDVSAGDRHTCAIASTGTMQCWGRNSSGQLGIGGTQAEQTPTTVSGTWIDVAVGDRHTCAIAIDTTLWCWGANGLGQLGIGTNQNQTQPAEIPNHSLWDSVSLGDDHTCAVKIGRLYCWGANPDGQLGTTSAGNETEPARIDSLGQWSRVSAGSSGMCGIDRGDNLWCWGNVAGLSGVQIPEPLATNYRWAEISVKVGVCGITKNGAIYCWGTNGVDVPTRVGTSNDWAQIGGECAINTTDELWCWDQQLNLSQPAPGVSFVSLSEVGDCAISVGGDLYCQPYLGAHSYYAPTGGANTWTHAAGSRDYGCAINADQKLWCWGEGAFISYPTPTALAPAESFTEVEVGPFTIWAINSDGTLDCWGDGLFLGGCDFGPPGSGFRDLTITGLYAAALTD